MLETEVYTASSDTDVHCHSQSVVKVTTNFTNVIGSSHLNFQSIWIEITKQLGIRDGIYILLIDCIVSSSAIFLIDWKRKDHLE